MKIRRALRRLICLSSIILFAVSSLTVLADIPELPPDIGVKWIRPTDFLSLSRNGKKAVIHTENERGRASFTVTFPTEGGVRIHTADTGRIEPHGTGNITYKKIRDNVWQMSGVNGTTARFASNSKTWALTVYNSEGVREYTVDARQIGLGYRGRTIEKVLLEGNVEKDEVIYGFGEQFRQFNQVGDKITLWNTDNWSEDAYKNIPFFHSSTGYSLFFNSAFYGEADIAAADSDIYTLMFHGSDFDFYVWTGSPLENIQSYTFLTGRQCLSPKWSFSYWAGGTSVYWESQGAGNSLNLLAEVMRAYRSIGTPNISTMFGEDVLWRNTNTYNLLRTTGTRLIGWYMPFASHNDMVYYCGNASSSIADYALPAYRSLDNPWSYYSAGNMQIDFSHPNAYTYVKSLWGSRIEQGLKGLMCDYGEYTPYDTLAYNGMSGSEMHNSLAFYYLQTMDKVFSEYYPDGDYFLLARPGAAGSQKYAATFSADQHGDFAGLRKVVNAGLGINASGFSTWGSDIGGIDTTKSSEVYARWMQFGAFSPIMRIHGSRDNNPTNFGSIGISTYQTHYWLRENLLDFIYSKSIEANKTGSPMIKSLAVAYNNEASLAAVDDEYLFCDELLVCPILSDGVRYKKVKLPEGEWYSLWTGAAVSGGKTVTADAPITKSPVYLKSGAVIPIELSAKTLELTDSMQNGGMVSSLLVTPPEKGGQRSYTHWTDADTSVTYTAAAADGGFTISSSRADNTGVISAYGVNAVSVTVDGVKLKKLSEAPLSTDEAGYYVDGYKQTLIRLPENTAWKEIAVDTGKSKNVNLARNAKVTLLDSSKDTSAVNDGDVSTKLVLNNPRKEEIIFDLKNTYSVYQVALKYDRFYSPDCTVSVSADGNSWTEAAAFKDMIDEAQYLSLPLAKARYLKITGLSSQNSIVNLLEVEIYGDLYQSAEETNNGDTNGSDDYGYDEDDNGSKDDNEEITENSGKKKKMMVKKIIRRAVENGNWLIYLIIGGAAVLIAASVIVILVLCKKKKKV